MKSVLKALNIQHKSFETFLKILPLIIERKNFRNLCLRIPSHYFAFFFCLEEVSFSLCVSKVSS